MGLEAVDFIMKETEIRVVFIDQLKRLRLVFRFVLADRLGQLNFKHHLENLKVLFYN